MRYNHNGVISEITSLPGCDQIAVLHNTWVPLWMRGQGAGGQAHEDRLEEVKRLGYDLALCTVASTNDAEKKILARNGWKWLAKFKSSKTGHLVELFGKGIDQSPPPQTFEEEINDPRCEKYPKCQEEYEYCTCARKAGWEMSKVEQKHDCKALECKWDCVITGASHCANTVNNAKD